MILCIDAGNTQLYCGLFSDAGEILLRFRKVSDRGNSSDELGLFFRGVIRENGFDPDEVSRCAVCSVVPDTNHALRNSCLRYFGSEPFILKAGVRTGLKIRYKNPAAVGADRIANAVAAVRRYPESDVIIIDFGTATTCDVITKDRSYLGGAIFAGTLLSMQALESRTAKLPKVEIMIPEAACGRTTEESIQSGLYHSTIGSVRELVRVITDQEFSGKQPLLLATGGLSGLFRDAGIFDEILPDLVLEGLFTAQEMNR